MAGVPRALLGGLHMVGNREVVNMVGWFSEATGTFGALVEIMLSPGTPETGQSSQKY